jgi:uncharacterized protein (DUF2062 family)
MALLVQGLTPEKLALTLAVGTALGLFPIIGATTLLCLAAGFMLRLNQPAIQLVNYLIFPAQMPLILAFVRLGETLLGARPVTFSPIALVERFRQDAPAFVREFGRTGLHGILGWSVVAPLIVAGVYLATVPFLRRLDAALRRTGRPSTPPS